MQAGECRGQVLLLETQNGFVTLAATSLNHVLIASLRAVWIKPFIWINIPSLMNIK